MLITLDQHHFAAHKSIYVLPIKLTLPDFGVPSDISALVETSMAAALACKAVLTISVGNCTDWGLICSGITLVVAPGLL
ncbi:LOW QUALITY PROTEIN: hypothetical protein KUTeg_015979 [Tegillarca granosa]|uniref:Uncharacterized protein n=1 Tax=Tegillarca granosa TaxID=220873 RepID=A0ABQ9EJH8_TEGGR|nr:LOW QUALITY PROTEIN: hypothetical protein KUTeg_015979 [Tegillarca granosa]